MNIIETGLKFGSLSYRKATTRIILHHAAAPNCSAEDIHRWHKQKGWSGAGYHFLVRKDGSVYRLRPEAAVGAHASNNNSNSLGICFEGNFETEVMTDSQKRAGAELVAYLKSRYGIGTVQRHKDVGKTSCPGKNFPFEEIASGQQTSPAPSPAPTPAASGKYPCYAVCTGNGVRVRTQPSKNAPDLKSYPRLNKGNEVMELGEDNGFNKVLIADKYEGWVWGEYLAD